MWEELVLAVVGNSLIASLQGKSVNLTSDITGVVIKNNKPNYKISIWTRTADSERIASIWFVCREIFTFFKGIY